MMDYVESVVYAYTFFKFSKERCAQLAKNGSHEEEIEIMKRIEELENSSEEF